MEAGELRGILRGRDFRRLYGTRLASQFSDGVFQVALAGYVFFSPERQTTATKAAAAFAVTLLPYSALGPFAGVFIDRWQRRQILVWTPVVRAVLVLLVAALVAAGQDGLGFFLGVLVVLGVNRFFLAALSAALPHVVRRDQLVTANAFTVTSGTVIAFAGAGVGYLLRRLFGSGHDGTASILVVAAALFLLAGATATTLPRRLLGPHPAEDALPGAPRAELPRTVEALGGVLYGLADGARHIARRPQAALALGAISFHRFLYGIVLIMTLLLCRNHFADDPDRGLETFALMLGVSGAGYFAAALITPPVVRRISKQAWVAWLLAGAALSLLLLGTPFAERPWAAGAFLLGVVSQGVKLCVDTTLQEGIEDAYRGRVFAVYDMLFNATFAAAAAAAATWLPPDGRATVTLLAVIAAYAAGAVAYRTAASRMRRPAHALR
ncbi:MULTISPECIES: MFS transporter [Actinomadura]|uniref:Major Facilitator Superfamily protein n=1 Tax=Actinomadura madurae TaxID=1993 RepID=A0A1I5YIF2_9ACTN|nr:MFS transporter [Actinomadura madurae]MCP9981447.1 MFS transporter [Actinomadura madurae]MCQ0007040.1 MFS transporter [Actinomadura madurae]MCQ0017652.1 MFS transporter [Actinomadura madurae]SFQ44004.1 Major Facilitator Superfamily protein [Actinomadura madurae]